MNSMDSNPYAPPLTPADATVFSTSSEAMRQAHIKHEASVKSVGTLYFLGTLLLGGLGVILVLLTLSPPQQFPASRLGEAGFYLVVAAVQACVAIGLWRLQPWARWSATAFSVLGLIVFPLGTLISGYILYLLLCEKGRVVFSAEYKQVIAETPHIKYRTSRLMIALLFFLLLVFVVAIISALML
jgi:hypothetical protein